MDVRRAFNKNYYYYKLLTMSPKKLGERSLLFALCIVTAFAVAAATPVVTRSVFDPTVVVSDLTSFPSAPTSLGQQLYS